MLRVAYVIGEPKGHAVRGIDVYNKNLLPELQKLGKKRGFSIESITHHLPAQTGDAIIHWPYFDFFFDTLKPASGVKNVVTVYDCIPLIYSKHYPAGFRGMINFRQQKNALKKADAVITISETSKKDIVRFLDVPAEKIHVVYAGPGNPTSHKVLRGKQDGIKKKYDLPEKFILYVGDVNYNKNIVNLVKAIKIAKIPLVIVGKHATMLEDSVNYEVHLEGPRDMVRWFMGKPHPEISHYKELIDEIESTKLIRRLGFVETDELSAIYNLASIYCQPSFYEGFGMPVLEAFSSFVPVVAARTQALVEIASDAAYYVDPNDPKDIANGLKAVLDNLKIKDDLVKKGSKRSKEFSWEKTARLVIDVYKSLAGS